MQYTIDFMVQSTLNNSNLQGKSKTVRSLINQYSAKHCDSNWTIHGVLREIQYFGLQFTAFSGLVTRLKHGYMVV